MYLDDFLYKMDTKHISELKNALYGLKTEYFKQFGNENCKELLSVYERFLFTFSKTQKSIRSLEAQKNVLDDKDWHTSLVCTDIEHILNYGLNIDLDELKKLNNIQREKVLNNFQRLNMQKLSNLSCESNFYPFDFRDVMIKFGWNCNEVRFPTLEKDLSKMYEFAKPSTDLYQFYDVLKEKSSKNKSLSEGERKQFKVVLSKIDDIINDLIKLTSDLNRTFLYLEADLEDTYELETKIKNIYFNLDTIKSLVEKELELSKEEGI